MPWSLFNIRCIAAVLLQTHLAFNHKVLKLNGVDNSEYNLHINILVACFSFRAEGVFQTYSEWYTTQQFIFAADSFF